MVSPRVIRIVAVIFLFLVFLSLLIFFVEGKITGRAVTLKAPLVQGQELRGSFVVDPSSVGPIPTDSMVRIDLNTLSLERPLTEILSPVYLAQYEVPAIEFAPALIATFRILPQSDLPRRGGDGHQSGCTSDDLNCFTAPDPCATTADFNDCLSGGKGGGSESLSAFAVYAASLATEGTQVSVVVSQTSPGSFTLSSGEAYVLEKVTLHGEPASTGLISVKQEGNQIKVSTDYTELVAGIDPTAPPFEVSLTDFDVSIPPRGELRAGILYRDQILTQSASSFYSLPASALSNPEALSKLQDTQLIPGAPLTKDLIENGCGSYVCSEWGTCSVLSLKELIDVEKTLSLIQTRECMLDCGVSFPQTKPCELDKKLISVVPGEAQSEQPSEGEGGSTGSSGGSSISDRKDVFLFDQKTAVPVARIELRTENEKPSLDIVLTQSQRALSTYCYNGKLDAASGEEDIDCGGYCAACIAQRISVVSITLWVLVFIGLVVLAFAIYPRFYE